MTSNDFVYLKSKVRFTRRNDNTVVGRNSTVSDHVEPKREPSIFRIQTGILDDLGSKVHVRFKGFWILGSIFGFTPPFKGVNP